MSGLVITVEDAGVLHLRLDRPELGNSIDLPTAEALLAAIKRAAADTSVRAVLVSGEGSRFCTGGDLSAMNSTADAAAYVFTLATTLDAAMIELDALVMPVVCAAQGAVAGAGLALMLASDIVVAEEGCVFTMAYSKVGLTPDCGVSWLLPRAIGQVRALDMALTNRLLNVEEALSWGLVSRVEADARVAAAELAQTLASGPADALGQTRRLLRASWSSRRDETGRDEASTISAMIGSEDARARIGSFTRR